MADIESVQLKVGLEIHVELATRTKMFSRSPNPAHPDHSDAAPNTLIDPVVLGLPGALPVMNRSAVEMSIMVGLALGCTIATSTRWDRKSYFYPDLPKNYQISQYQLPLCFDGAVDLPSVDDEGHIDWKLPPQRIGIVRAHLEEDAGKLLHEAPGGHAIDFSIVDLNRAGTPLLEIVTQPDFTDADSVVRFARTLRNTCRFLGVSEGVMQKGHMRFEPNINTVITLSDGRTVTTPIVEIKNLNSFKALRAAVEHEHKQQPGRWREDGREMGAGTKTTRGWDDAGARTVVQREKEDAHDYRYFPDPDLPPLEIDPAWVERIAGDIGELPVQRMKRYIDEYLLTPKEAAAITDERDVCLFYEKCVDLAADAGIHRERAGRRTANILLQSGAKRANERSVLISELGATPEHVAGIVRLRENNEIGSTAADELFGLLCDPANRNKSAREVADERNMLTVRDEAALENWCDAAIAEDEKSAADVRAGKTAAIGRLIGAVMKHSGGAADPKAARARLLEKLDAQER